MLKIIEKTWNEFWAAYWRIEYRHKIPRIFEWDIKLVNFIEKVCQLKPGTRILDLGCGGGDQAKVFAKKGYQIVGIDIAPSLIEFAKKQFQKEGLKGNFIKGDMRNVDYQTEFDACILLSGTFGYFSDTENQNLLRSIYRALKPGGKVFIMFLSANRLPKHKRLWSEIENGWELTESWFDPETSTYRTKMFVVKKDGTLLRPKAEKGYHANETIRCYTIPEMRTMLEKANLHYMKSFSGDDLSVPQKPPASEEARNIVVAERPPEN